MEEEEVGRNYNNIDEEELRLMVIPDSYQLLSDQEEEEEEEDEANNNNNDDDDVLLEEEKSSDEEKKFYKVWFDGYVRKHGLDINKLEENVVRELEKKWVEAQVVAAQMRSKEAQIDINLIQAKYSLCQHWFSSL